MRADLLPLFPLQLVLFPGTPLPLHIFEERYKEMIGNAMERNTEFGIVMASEKGIVNIGTTAVVDQVVQRYPDGRLDIIVVGRRRFEIQELNDELAYLRGEVEFFDDEDEAEVTDELRSRVMGAYEEILKLGTGSALLDPELGEGDLSFRLAQVITDVNLRQLLLTSRSPLDRMKQLAAHLPQLLNERRETSRMKRAASTNGHGRRPVELA
jgi:Lon protease-like protein